jgi:hypothetical protein
LVALYPCEEVVTEAVVFSLSRLSTCGEVAPREEGYAAVDRAERQIDSRERGRACRAGGYHAEKGANMRGIGAQATASRRGDAACGARRRQSAAMQGRTARAARMQAAAAAAHEEVIGRTGRLPAQSFFNQATFGAPPIRAGGERPEEQLELEAKAARKSKGLATAIPETNGVNS